MSVRHSGPFPTSPREGVRRTDFAYKDPTSQKLLANAITSLPIKVNNVGASMQVRFRRLRSSFLPPRTFCEMFSRALSTLRSPSVNESMSVSYTFNVFSNLLGSKLCNSLRQEIQSWKTADPLQSLVEIPEKIEKFCEKQRVSLTVRSIRDHRSLLLMFLKEWRLLIRRRTERT